MILPKSPVRKAKFIKELMDNLDKKVEEEKRIKIMQNCGRECMGRSVIQKARRLKKKAKDIDEFLELLNKSGIGGGSLKREGNIICGQVLTQDLVLLYLKYKIDSRRRPARLAEIGSLIGNSREI